MLSVARTAFVVALGGIVATSVVAADDSEEKDLDEQHERRLKLNIIILTVTVLVGISLTFEWLKERLLEYTSDNMLPIINSLFGELTLLGFIGLSLYLVFTFSWFSTLSRRLYGDPKKLNDIGEVVHMVLFMVMVLFLAQAVAMARMGEATQRKWRDWESRSFRRLSQRTCIMARRLLDACYTELLLDPYQPKQLRALVFAATRRIFMLSREPHDAEFDFANYLAIALGRTFAEIVEVPVKTWLGLEACLLIFFFVDSVLSKYLRFALWILLGYCILTMAFIVHAKLRIVLRQHVKLVVEEAIDANQNCCWTTDVRNPRNPTHSQSSFRTVSVRKPPDYALEPQNLQTGPVPASMSGANVELGGLHEKMPSTSACQSHLSNEEQVDPMDDPLVDPLDESRAPLWLSTERGQGSLRELHDGVGRSGSTYNSKWWNWILGCTLTMAQRCGDAAACVFRALDRAFNLAHGCAAQVFHAVCSRKHDSQHPSQMPSHGPDTGYANMFWFGATHKAHFTLDVIRTIPLFMSIYIAVFALIYAPRLYPKAGIGVLQHMQNVVLVAISTIPPIALQFKLPFVVEDFTIAANVGAFRNQRYIEQVLVHQKAVIAFQALRAVACLQSPDILANLMNDKAHHGDATNDSDPGCELQSLHALDPSIEDEHIDKTEEQEANELYRRRSWEKVFQLFDASHRGWIDREQLREMLSKFISKFSKSDEESTVHIEKIISLLDDDNNQKISFKEFYQFGCLLEDHFDRGSNPNTLIEKMFYMINEGHGNFITVESLHRTMTSIGLDLSVNVVYNMIRNIDEDGNGALDLHEFRLLIERMNVSTSK